MVVVAENSTGNSSNSRRRRRSSSSSSSSNQLLAQGLRPTWIDPGRTTLVAAPIECLSEKVWALPPPPQHLRMES